MVLIPGTTILLFSLRSPCENQLAAMVNCTHTAATFVSMSRVEDLQHIRLLERNMVQSRSSFYTYLQDIKPDKNIAPFLHGYAQDGLPWDPNLALSYSKTKKAP